MFDKKRVRKKSVCGSIFIQIDVITSLKCSLVVSKRSLVMFTMKNVNMSKRKEKTFSTI